MDHFSINEVVDEIERWSSADSLDDSLGGEFVIH